MRKEKKQTWQLALGILAFAVILYIFFSFAPTLTITLVMILLIFISLWGFLKFGLKNTTQATLISATLSIYLLVRTLGLKDLVFAILFLILFATLQLFFKRS